MTQQQEKLYKEIQALKPRAYKAKRKALSWLERKISHSIVLDKDLTKTLYSSYVKTKALNANTYHWKALASKGRGIEPYKENLVKEKSLLWAINFINK